MPAESPLPDARSDPRRERLFEAAAPLFERYGYRKTTIEEICREAGMSKRTFYEIYEDKGDLFLDLIQSYMNRIAEEWEQNLPGDYTPLQKLESLLTIYERMIREHPSVLVVVEDLDLMHKFSERIEMIRFLQIGGAVHNLLKEGVASGQFREMDTGIAIWLIFTLLDTVYMLLPAWMGTPGALENRALAEETRRFIINGLGAREETVR